MVYKHEDIDRHHMHIVTIRVKEDGKAISSSNNFYQSKRATRELEKGGATHTISGLRRSEASPTMGGTGAKVRKVWESAKKTVEKFA